MIISYLKICRTKSQQKKLASYILLLTANKCLIDNTNVDAGYMCYPVISRDHSQKKLTTVSVIVTLRGGFEAVTLSNLVFL